MAFKQNLINREQILPPVIMFTTRALDQLKLIIENDFTLAGKYFRLLISGKGCEGFTYSAGFTDLQEDDFEIKISNTEEDIRVIIDPFAAFYMQECSVDYIQDFTVDSEGFVVTNHSQSEFKGKFWRSAPEKTPPLKVEN